MQKAFNEAGCTQPFSKECQDFVNTIEDANQEIKIGLQI
ncbi:MAG: hypothetical protein CM15mV51_0350 [uncultured marine virus]|nr:MAG: hypothetical protein CM15mV51_0350 [uncultured marine virus]